MSVSSIIDDHFAQIATVFAALGGAWVGGYWQSRTARHQADTAVTTAANQIEADQQRALAERRERARIARRDAYISLVSAMTSMAVPTTAERTTNFRWFDDEIRPGVLPALATVMLIGSERTAAAANALHALLLAASRAQTNAEMPTTQARIDTFNRLFEALRDDFAADVAGDLGIAAP